MWDEAAHHLYSVLLELGVLGKALVVVAMPQLAHILGHLVASLRPRAIR